MTSSLGQPMDSDIGYQTPAAEKVSLLAGLVVLFIFGAVTVSILPSLALKILGWVLAFAAVVFSLREGLRFTPEMTLFLAWLGWALTGLIGAFSAELFWEHWFTALQIGGLILIISTFARNRKSLSICLGTVVVAGAVLGIHAFLTGEFTRAQTTTEPGLGPVRAAGLALNPNALGWLMVLITAALAYFWMMPSRRPVLRKTVLIAGMMGAGMAAVLSGSRMGIIAYGVFYLAWFWFCYRKLFVRRIGLAIAVILFAGVGAYLFASLMSSSGAAGRMAAIAGFMRGEHEGGVSIRIQLLRKALELLLEHPLTGVGLGNFQMQGVTHSYGAHSEYGAIASQTGFPGVVLYFGVLFVMWWRASRLTKGSRDPVVARAAGLTKAFLLTLFVALWANVISNDKSTWVFLACLAGYTHAMWRQMRAAPVPAPETSEDAIPLLTG